MTRRPLFTFGPQPSQGEDFDPLLGRSVSEEALSGDPAGGLEFDDMQAQSQKQDPYEDWFSIRVTTSLDTDNAGAGNTPAFSPPAWTQFKVKSTEQIPASVEDEPTKEETTPDAEVHADDQLEHAETEQPPEPGPEEQDAASLKEPAAPEPEISPIQAPDSDQNNFAKVPAAEAQTGAEPTAADEPDVTEATLTQRSPAAAQDWDVPLLPKLRGLETGVWNDAPILGRKAAQAGELGNGGLFGLGTVPVDSWDTPSPKPASSGSWEAVTDRASAEPPVVAEDQTSRAPEPSGVIPALEPEPAAEQTLISEPHSSASPPASPTVQDDGPDMLLTEGHLHPADLVEALPLDASDAEDADTALSETDARQAADDENVARLETQGPRPVPEAVVAAFDRLRAATADLNGKAGTDEQREALPSVQDDQADVETANVPIVQLEEDKPAGLQEATPNEDATATASEIEPMFDAGTNDGPLQQTSDPKEMPASPKQADAVGQTGPTPRGEARQGPAQDPPTRRARGPARETQAKQSRRTRTATARKPVRRTPAWVLFSGFVTFAVSLMLIAASMAAPLSNAFHTISVFLWYWAGMAAASAAIWAAGRRWAMTFASLVLTAFALYFLIPASGIGSVNAPTAHTIGWVNLQGSQEALTEVLRDAEAEEVDLMILAELPQGFAAPPQGWSMIEQPIPGDPQALAVLSKGNWRAVTVKDEPTMARPLDNAVTVIAVNASGGAEGALGGSARQSVINRAAARAGTQDTAAIAVGDFGEPAWTQQMRQFAEYSRGQRLRCGGWLGATYSRFGGLLGWSADHAFIINGAATKCKIGGGLPGTNHRPLWIGVPAAPAGVSPSPL